MKPLKRLHPKSSRQTRVSPHAARQTRAEQFAVPENRSYKQAIFGLWPQPEGCRGTIQLLQQARDALHHAGAEGAQRRQCACVGAALKGCSQSLLHPPAGSAETSMR